MERTFIMIKPDGVRRRLVGEIVRRIERKDYAIIAMKMLVPSRELAEQHYAMHKGKDFFEALLDFITSGPVVAMVIEGENALKLMRVMMGATNPENATSGSIRGEFAVTVRQNLIHGSDSPESAATEIALWFPELDAE